MNFYYLYGIVKSDYNYEITISPSMKFLMETIPKDSYGTPQRKIILDDPVGCSVRAVPEYQTFRITQLTYEDMAILGSLPRHRLATFVINENLEVAKVFAGESSTYDIMEK